MATKKSQVNTDNIPKVIKGLRKQVVSIGQIHYESKDEENFKEWRQRTLYLVNAAFGQGQRYDDLEEAIDSMPEKDATRGSYNSTKIYWDTVAVEDDENTDNDENEECEESEGSEYDEDEYYETKDVFNQEKWDEDYKKAKNWIQKLIKLYIEELELLTPSEPKAATRRGARNTLIATQTTDIKIDIKTEVKNLISYIHENESDPEKAKEAETKIKELGDELQKDTTKWSVVKDTLMWIANYSKDLFIRALPILLEHYGR